MQVLLIEDDDFKARRITQALITIYPTADLRTERSVNAGLIALAKEHPQLLLLDMSLSTFSIGPTEGGGRPQNFGGLDVMEQMDRLGLVTPVIVITQFNSFKRDDKEISLEKLEDELKQRYPVYFKALIFYNSRESRWERQLRKILISVFGSSND